MAATPAKRGHTWREVLAALRQPRVAITLILGFSSGLPFMLTGNTLGFWLREEGIELAAIGFLSWVGIAYSMKFLWAPMVDKVDAPILGKWLGRRRGWIVLAQLIIGAGLFAMAMIGPKGGLGVFAAFALCVAFASATQDIVIDAWRIERSESDEDLGLLTAAYQLGYRAAILATDALILLAAARIGWSNSYVLCALAVGIGLTATLFAAEPKRFVADRGGAPAPLSMLTPRGLFDAIAGPFIQFFRAHGSAAILMLAAISLYRLPDFVMGPMANPFYVDLGLTKETVGGVRATIGLAATIAGITLGGLSAVSLGFTRTLVLGAILGPGSNLAFAALAYTGASLPMFSAVMVVDNVATGFAGAALVAYMSSLTSLGYTATQYALLSSFYALLGKVLKGFSGQIVETLEQTWGQLTAYAIFFAGTAVVGFPALILCLMLGARHNRDQRRLAAAPA
jgi:MFS transporter, PAT family, beta-lactamase induction signal transducer AmpG